MTTVTQPAGYATAPIDSTSDRTHRRAIASVLQGAMQGRINCTLRVTLTPSATSSTVVDNRISVQSAVLMSPRTAHAAADMASMWFVPVNGSVTINHASNAYTDRTFIMVIVG